MNTGDILFSIVGWIVILGVLFWYANKKRHPSRSPLNAFLVLIGIFFSVLIVTMFVVVGAIYTIGQEEGGWASSLGPIIGLFVVIPTWHFSVSKIKIAPKKNA